MNYNNLLNKIVYTTLRECSYDKKHNVFMVNSREKCIDALVMSSGNLLIL